MEERNRMPKFVVNQKGESSSHLQSKSALERTFLLTDTFLATNLLDKPQRRGRRSSKRGRGIHSQLTFPFKFSGRGGGRGVQDIKPSGPPEVPPRKSTEVRKLSMHKIGPITLLFYSDMTSLESQEAGKSQKR